jgi:molybdopterin biosynthesis enzyme
VVSLARANAFLVSEPDREAWSAGELIQVMLK